MNLFQCQCSQHILKHFRQLFHNLSLSIMTYQCEFDECDKSYTNGVNLTEHVAKFHGKFQEFKCDFCIRSFINNSNLKRHKETIHQNPKTKEEENSVHFL